MIIDTVHATDMDSGLNGQVNYKFDEQAGNFFDIERLFEINPTTGVISLKWPHVIDRELNTSIEMSIVAFDSGLPHSKSTKTKINICVLDVNDNAPQFNDLDTPNSLFIEENSMRFNFTPRVTDLDFSYNGTLFYYLDADNKHASNFLIDPFSGILSLAKPLDFESMQSFSLSIVASDNGRPIQLKTKLNLTINVVDQNDNRPRFDLAKNNSNFITVVNKLEPIQQIAKFEAVDQDISEKFRNTTYRISWILGARSNALDIRQPLSDSELKPFELNLFELDPKRGVLTKVVPADLSNLTSSNYFLLQLEAFDQDKQVFIRF